MIKIPLINYLNEVYTLNNNILKPPDIKISFHQKISKIDSLLYYIIPIIYFYSENVIVLKFQDFLN